MNRLHSYTLLLIAVCLLTVSCAGDGTTTLRCSLILGPHSDWYKGVERFKELVEERTGGQYRITIYPDAQLAGQEQRAELEMVQSGVIDISLESSILLSLIEPSMSVLSMPWLFDSYDEVNRVLDGPLGDELLALLPEKGLVGLAYGANGFRQLTNSGRPVSGREDIRGLKIRVPAIKMYIDVFKLMGADPSAMNFGELFTALAQGTMDGQENPLSVIHSKRLYEVQDNLTIWDYSYDPIILCINKNRWDSFSPEIQQIFSECAREAMNWQRDIVAAGEATLADTLASKGMTITRLDAEARLAFRELTQPVYEQYAPVIGEDLLDRFVTAAEENQ